MPSLGLNPLLKTSFSFLSHNCSPQDQIKGGIETKQDPVGPFQEQKSFCVPHFLFVKKKKDFRLRLFLSAKEQPQDKDRLMKRTVESQDS